MATVNKMRETPAWLHEMPCGDKSHAHQNPVLESTARAICRLPKIMVARKVDGVYVDAPEHRPSVTSVLVARVHLEAERTVREQELSKSDEADELEEECTEEDVRNRKVNKSQEENEVKDNEDDPKQNEVKSGNKAAKPENKIENVMDGEWETVNLEDAAGQDTTQVITTDDWEMVDESRVPKANDYVLKQMQSGQASTWYGKVQSALGWR